MMNFTINKKKFWIFIIPLFVLASCKKDDPEPQNLQINKRIFSSMQQVYLWNNTLTADNIPDNTDPEEYYNSLLNKPTDKWSFIVDNYNEFKQQMSGNPTSMGYEAVYGKFSNSDNVYAVVKFVYPDSPSDNAGLKKGDIILEVDNTPLTTDNYQDLFSQESYTLTLGKVQNNVVVTTSTKLSMTAELLDVNPVIHEEIYSINSKDIGYMAISEFIGSEKFIEKVSSTISNLKSANINDLIIDLRYNTGGDLNSAIWLGSVLAPIANTQNNDIFVQLMYNDLIQEEMEKEGETKFPFLHIPDINIGLPNLYFLTTNFATASASELVISGLEPYLNVIQIGENTVGKYQGMWVLPHEDKEWAIMPVTFKYANAENFSDFTDGLIPDVQVDEDLIAGYELGDTEDPMIATALELITGLPTRKKAEENIFRNFSVTYSDQQKLKMNVFSE